MGVITIEIPQRIKRTYKVRSRTTAQEILDSLDRVDPAEKSGRSNGTTKNGTSAKSADDLGPALDSVAGMWTYRKESTEAIAGRLRAGWDRSDAK